MAGPHVAGLVGLLISAVPAAAGEVDLLEEVIRQSAFHPTAAAQVCGGVDTNVFPNNTFGAGRIDALAAVNLLLSQSGFQTAVTPPSQAVCAPANALFDVAVGQLGAFSEPVTLSATGNPAGSTVDFLTNPVAPPGTSLMTVTTTGVAAGASTITVTGTALPSGLERTDTATLEVFTTGAAAPTLVSPANAATNVAVRPTFTWSAAAGAAAYLLEVDDADDFASPVYSAALTGTSHAAGTDLPSRTELHWRVTASNPCGSAPSAARSFTTVTLPGDCAIGAAANAVYEYGFEAGASGWASSGTLNTWAQSSARVHSGAFAWRAEDVTSTSDQRLVSPAVTLPSGQLPLTLQFWNYQALEDRTGGCYDGGLLEISTDGGTTFTPITAGLLTDPYDGPISGTSPSLNGWCGDPQDWLKTVVDLAPWVGQTVRFRFRVLTDDSVGRAPDGWHLDDIRVQSCLVDTTLFRGDFETGDTSQWSSAVP